MRARAAWCGAFLACASLPAAAQNFKVEHAYELKPGEGVFAYARLTPDGRFLAYASQARGRPNIETIVDLSTSKVVFSEAGIDAYFSTDGERMIFSSFAGGGVTIRHLDGRLVRNVVPGNLGDYYSWGMRDGKNLILTIASNYYYLDGDSAVLPASHIESCPGIGTGERPLLSRDGKQITTFVRGTVVVRNLTDCNYTFDTGLMGGKADFSWDGRYIAFDVAKPENSGYDVVVVDLNERTVRTLPLKGNGFFPSWLRDGRLCFRYDGDDYKGFVFASNVMSLPARKLEGRPGALPDLRRWKDIFPGTVIAKNSTQLVMVWATWSAHSPIALRDLQAADLALRKAKIPVRVMIANEPGSKDPQIEEMIRTNRITLPRILLPRWALPLTEATNQVPVTMLFKDGVLVDRKLGAQTTEQLVAWVRGYH
jgi:hypothetical protein